MAIKIIKDIVEGILGPASVIIDELHTSKEEKLEAQLKLQALIFQATAQADEQAKEVILAEAKGESWLQRNWRPLLMTEFGVIIGWNYLFSPLATFVSSWFGGPVFPMLEIVGEFWTLLTIGLGGYIAARTYEKTQGKAGQGNR